MRVLRENRRQDPCEVRYQGPEKLGCWKVCADTDILVDYDRSSVRESDKN